MTCSPVEYGLELEFATPTSRRLWSQTGWLLSLRIDGTNIQGIEKFVLNQYLAIRHCFLSLRQFRRRPSEAILAHLRKSTRRRFGENSAETSTGSILNRRMSRVLDRLIAPHSRCVKAEEARLTQGSFRKSRCGSIVRAFSAWCSRWSRWQRVPRRRTSAARSRRYGSRDDKTSEQDETCV